MKPNDICDACGKPAYIPTHAVRCEWGCCYRDVEGSDRQRAAHECSTCGAETHRFSIAELLKRAVLRVPYLTPKVLRRPGEEKDARGVRMAPPWCTEVG